MSTTGEVHTEDEEVTSNVSVDVLPLPRRTLNALLKNGVYSLRDLNSLTTDTLCAMQGLGRRGVEAIADALVIISGNSHGNLRQELEMRLNSQELDIIYSRCGLVNSRVYTLEELAQARDITRERIRQIESRALKKIKGTLMSSAVGTDILQKLHQSADKYTFIDTIPELSDVYLKDGVIKLFAKVFPSDIAVCSHKYIERAFLLPVEHKTSIENAIDKIRNFLKIQGRMSNMQFILDAYNIPKHVLLAIRDVVVEDGQIALRGNRNIFERGTNPIVRRVLAQSERPLHIDEIARRANLKPSQVRGVLERIPDAVNVGRSVYAHIDLGYISGTTVEVIEKLLEQAGEPMTTGQIVKLMKKQKLYGDQAIYLALTDQRFQRIEMGVYVLRKWGYDQEYIAPHNSYATDTKRAILDIVNESTRPLSTRDVREMLGTLHGNRVSTKNSTVGCYLDDLARSGKIGKTKNGDSVYYARLD
jgi:predicted Zn-ribbon and HTH transcriptional regulator